MSDGTTAPNNKLHEDQQKRIVDELKETCLDNEQFLDLLVSKIADRAVEKTERTAAIHRNRTAIATGLFLSLVTALVTFGYSAVRDSIKSEAISAATDSSVRAARTAVDLIVAKSVRDEIEQEVGLARKNWNRLNDRLELTNLSERINKKGGFSEQEARYILRIIKGMADDDDYRNFTQFPKLLEAVVDTFQAADRDDLVRPLEAKFGDVMLDTQGISITMVGGLGRTLVGYPDLPSELGNGKLRVDWDSTVVRYHSYADAMRRHRFPEVPYIYDIVLACMEGQPVKALAALVGRIEEFDASERESVQFVVTNLLNEGWVAEKGSFSQRVRERTADCLGLHKDADPTGTVGESLLAVTFSSN